MTLIDQLNRLSEIAPEVCQKSGDEFIVGDYTFFEYDSPGFGFMAEVRANDKTHNVTGRPALAWLRDALEAAIEARGWYWEVSYPPHETTGEHWANIRIGESRYFYGEEAEAAAALAAAFVAAVEGEKERVR